jgi:hypothetical protein
VIRHRVFLLPAVLLLAATAGGAVMIAKRPQVAFPHEKHANLFPFCEGCHTVGDGNRATLFPGTDLCARCHDGTQVRTVSWSPPAPRPTLLRYDHVAHARAAVNEQPALECATCHARGPAVVRADPSTCLGCHAHPASDHYETAKCSTCHVPIVQSNAPATLTLELPHPRSHDDSSFVTLHFVAIATAGQTCQFCHTRDQCESCHVNAASIPAIAALPPAPANLRLARIEATYPPPESHRDAAFLSRHGKGVVPASCSTCHTRESCSTCHVERRPAVIADLPARQKTGAQGVTLARKAPFSHAVPQFVTNHGGIAVADRNACATCHTTNWCEQCHSAPAKTAFHPPDFMLSHSSAAYGGRLECSNCHDAKAFCRECHAGGGQVPSGRLLSPVYHDAEPLWLLRHGGAARRGLEGCTACHAQKDCLQCHSTIGAFRVNPHGRDFDARQAQSRNPIICKACHIVDPLGTGG